MNKNNKLHYLLHRLGALSFLGLLMVAGCATVQQPLQDNLQAQSAAVRQCAATFSDLDAAVDRAGVRDAEAYRIPGFPYLRIDRFSAQLRQAAANDAWAMAQWTSRLRALDQAARHAEISNLPEAERVALNSGGRAALADNTARCAELLRAHDLALPQRASLLSARAQVPDDYSTVLRVAGLYALSNVAFARGIAQWHSETLRDFQGSGEARTPAQPLTRYAIANPSVVTRERVAAIIRRASDNPLHVPEYTDADRALLAGAYAPVFEIATGGAYDRIGRLIWRTGVVPDVDTSAPVVYQRVALTRYGDRTLTQIVYTIWFQERPHDHALDMLAGRLDGVIFRVTLSPDGDPLVYDSIHACGCFHMFFPTARVQAIAAPDGAGEWAFVPATLPQHEVGARMAVRLATRTHYLINVAPDRAGDANAYRLLPEEELRALPAGQVTRSVYGPDGLVPGTERGERLFFWPMGIASAGAMRQWGHHATAFVGRRHFDDADLIEKRFHIITP